MADSKIIYCSACGSPLNVDLNRAYVFCQYCGSKNIIPEERMRSTMNVQGVQIQANTDIESILRTADYATQVGQYAKADELLMTTIMSGCDDYRVFIQKAKIDLLQDQNKSFFETMTRLWELDRKQSAQEEVTRAICDLMKFRGKNGVIALHIATFHELMDWTVYFVQHGADVNYVAGMNRVTPISIMFVPISSSLSRLDGTPFIRNKTAVKQIRDYLMRCGAQDIRRRGY